MKVPAVALIACTVLGTGLSLTCYSCGDSTCGAAEVKTCGPGERCFVKKMVEERTVTLTRGCGDNGKNISLNLGYVTVDLRSCSNDRCNLHLDVPAVGQMLNCHICAEKADDYLCNRTRVHACRGVEDTCVEIRSHPHKTEPSRVATMKGCASSSICSSNGSIAVLDIAANVTCCQRSPCSPASLPSPLLSSPLILLSLSLPLLLICPFPP